jgi:hypothetical protein
LAHLLLLL